MACFASCFVRETWLYFSSIFFKIHVTAGAFGILPWPTKKGTRMSDMIAFLIVAGYCCIYLAVAGCIGFFSEEQTRLNADPFYSHSDFYVEHLAIPMFGYQV
jgi:hypothetical protein